MHPKDQRGPGLRQSYITETVAVREQSGNSWPNTLQLSTLTKQVELYICIDHFSNSIPAYFHCQSLSRNVNLCIYIYVYMYFILRPLIGPQITWSVQGLSLVKPPPPLPPPPPPPPGLDLWTVPDDWTFGPSPAWSFKNKELFQIGLVDPPHTEP